MEVLWIVMFCFTVFFFQDIVGWVARKLSKVDAKIAGMAIVVLMAVALLRTIIWTEMATWGKVSLLLVVVGWVILMGAGILSLLFVATIPEDMEEEADDQ